MLHRRSALRELLSIAALLPALLAGCGPAATAPSSLPADAGSSTTADAAAMPTHRRLRDNAATDLLTPTKPVAFSGYPEAPEFTVVPQTPGLTLYPCSACHAALPPNPEPRALGAPHVASLPHGKGRFWCLDCHETRDRDLLRTLRGQQVSFDESYLVCGQCHFRQQKDWYFGAHGKRVANWQGDREIFGCAHCHDPHDPAVKPRAAGPPPKIRAGLEPMPARSAHR